MIREARYWNSNGHGIAIVASISIWGKDSEGTERGDWAAYIGADNGQSEEACIISTKEEGDKLSEPDARHFFPDIELPYRR